MSKSINETLLNSAGRCGGRRSRASHGRPSPGLVLNLSGSWEGTKVTQKCTFPLLDVKGNGGGVDLTRTVSVC